MNKLNKLWDEMVKWSFEMKMDYIIKDGKEIIIDRKNKQFFIKCRAKDLQNTEISI